MKTKALNIAAKVSVNACTFLFAVLMVGGQIAFDNKNMISEALGQETQKVVKDPNAENKDKEYYKSAFASVKDEKSYAKRFGETIEAEGAVLLKNGTLKDDNKALPLAQNAKVSLFSTSSVNPILTGSGSGGNASSGVTLQEGLEAAGLEVNEDLYNWYLDNSSTYGRKNVYGTGGVGTVSNINEAPWDKIDEAAKNKPADAAIFVLSRTGGEGIDSTLYAKDNKANVYNQNVTFDYKDGNYLKLNDTERDVLNNLIKLRNEGTFKEVILLMNTTNQVELNFLDDIDIDAVIWGGSFGATGSYAIGDILVGNVNPSGRLPDTFWKNHYLNPVLANFGTLVNSKENPEVTQWKTIHNPSALEGSGRHIVYQEGVYMGYRYTETRYEDVVLKDKENIGDFIYEDTVTYPFGYGLSYTNFSYSDFDVKVTLPNASENQVDTKYEISVKVTNDGKVEGKEPVQFYLQKPYTDYDIENHIEKPSVELVAFEKTKMLKPGESQVLTTVVDGKSLASYDAYKAKTYVVDAGNYYFTAAKDAHDATNNILSAKGKSLTDGMTEKGNGTLTYKFNMDFDDVTYSKSLVEGHEDVKITNQFDNADLNIYDTTGANKVNYVSRNNWNDTVKLGLTEDNKRTFNQVNVVVTDQMKADLAEEDKEFPDEGKGGEYPTFGSTKTNYTLAMLRAYDDGDGDPSNDKLIPYDDPMWQDLLDQVTWEEMCNLLGNAGYGNQAVASVSKPYVLDRDGGNGVIERYNVNAAVNKGLAVRTDDENKGDLPTSYPSNSIAAATFNKELCNYYGRIWGEDCLWTGVGGLYGVGLDTHRSPYGGRNFEYYSEDPYLMGKIAGEMVNGLNTRGAYAYLKHCLLNDQESYRCGGFTWANEQTIREIYLKSFEIAIVEDGASCVMTSLNSIGMKWAGSHGFVNSVLRDEFGMSGHVVTDSYSAHNGNFGHGLFYGNDLPLGNYGAGHFAKVAPVEEGGTGEYGNYAQAMRKATHNVLYSVAHSFYMNGMSTSDKIVVLTPPWVTVVTSLQITFGVLFGISVLAYGALMFFRRKETI